MARLEELIAQEYAAIPSVEAVALAGSHAGPFADAQSDFDLYVYATAVVPIDEREPIARRHSVQAETDNRFWEAGDEWVEHDGQRVDVMFRTCTWIEDQLARVLDRHEASIGYSTAFWFNVQTSKCLFDRRGWFAQLQRSASRRYPEELRRHIVAKNHPILRNTQSSYVYQIERALQRGDAISVNHRVAALLASFFDVLFALNRQPHPGEKRLLRWSAQLCPVRPVQMDHVIPQLIADASRGEASALKHVHTLLDELDEQLRRERLI